MGKFKLATEHKPLDFIFILALLCLFAFGSLMSVVLAANTYKSIKESSDSNFELHTPLSYISMKVRQHEENNAISIVKKEGVDALVLEGLDGDEICQTWIYEYQGSLYEVYLEKDTTFQLEDGLAILPINGLSFDLSNGVLKVQTADHNGLTRSITISLRTGQGGAAQ